MSTLYDQASDQEWAELLARGREVDAALLAAMRELLETTRTLTATVREIAAGQHERGFESDRNADRLVDGKHRRHAHAARTQPTLGRN